MTPDRYSRPTWNGSRATNLPWQTEAILLGRDDPMPRPAKAPTAADTFATWALAKAALAVDRKQIYAAMVVITHRYFADIRKHPDEQTALHASFQHVFEDLEQRLLELDPLLPESDAVIAGVAPPQAVGSFYQDHDEH